MQGNYIYVPTLLHSLVYQPFTSSYHSFSIFPIWASAHVVVDTNFSGSEVDPKV